MYSILKKEISSFFSSVTAYLVISVFLILTGLFMWVFTDYSVLDYNFASMEQLFSIGPLILLFLIPAITMRSFAEEKARGTIEFLSTKPLTDFQIVMGKFLANFILVAFALLPTLIYYYSIVELGLPKGNIDDGEVFGSYIGLFCLAGAFVAIGMFASALTDNQIVAFILGAFLCFIMHWAFAYLARIPAFIGNMDSIIQSIGMSHHYESVSRGALDTRDIIYFLSVLSFFIYLTYAVLKTRKA
jgi:ABC-2 type transport system permease protein